MEARRDSSFLTLPGTLPLDASDFEDLLTVPQHANDFCLSSSSSLDATDLFLVNFDGSETTSSLSSPTSDAGSRLQELSSDFPIALGDAADREQPQVPLAARLPLGAHGLKLRLDCASVLSAWHSMAGGCHPFQMRDPLLAAAAAAIPSASDLAASLSPSPSSLPSGLSPPSGGSVGDAAGEEAGRRDAAARLARDKKAGSRKSAERKVLYNPARKPGNDKRPRIKGRFVTKTEFEQVYVMASDRTVPAATMQRA